jgi:hypothetical protein
MITIRVTSRTNMPAKSKAPHKTKRPQSSNRLMKRRLRFGEQLAVIVGAVVVLGGFVLLSHSFAAVAPPEVENAAWTGQCLDDYQNKYANVPARVELFKCNGLASQSWALSSKRLEIHGRCLDVAGNSSSPGSKVDLYTCKSSGNANQQWAQDSKGRLVSGLTYSRSSMCLMPSSSQNGANLQIVPCNLDPSQRWNFNTYPPTDVAKASSGSGASSGTGGTVASTGGGSSPLTGAAYEIASGVMGKCLDDFHNNATTKANPVISNTCNATAAQQWTPLDGQLEHRNECLDVAGAGVKVHTHVDLYPCNHQINQQWAYDATKHQLMDKHSKLCLDLPGATTANNVQLQIYTCNNTTAQKWTFQTPAVASTGVSAASGSGLAQIKGSNNLCLNAVAPSTLQTATCSSAAAMQWKQVTVTTTFGDASAFELDGGSECLGNVGFTDDSLVHLQSCGSTTAGRLTLSDANVYQNPAGELQAANGRNLCITTDNYEHTVGIKFHLETCANLPSQKWAYQ